MSRKGRDVTREELTLWLHAMRDVHAFKEIAAALPMADEDGPAAADRPEPAPPPIPPVRPVTRGPAPPAPPKAELVPGRAAGVDKRSVERLNRGEREIEAKLDLHGMTREEAHGALSHFVFGAAERGLRCVLVVTGKGRGEGGGVLKAEVPRWLNTEPLRGQILAFSRARPRHGGDGALYLLLKRRR